MKKIAKEVLKKNILITITLSVVQYLTLKDKKMSTNESDISTSLFEKVLSMDNYKEVDKDKISYVDKIDTKQNCTFWGTSDDELVTSQVKLFPKDKNKKYIRVVDSKYYELDDSLTKTVDRYFK